MVAIFPSQINEDYDIVLMEPINEVELKKAITKMQSNKSSGPNGFLIEIFRDLWDLLHQDLLKIMEWTILEGKVSTTLNTASLTMIPKINSPLTFDQFCLISLCMVFTRSF